MKVSNTSIDGLLKIKYESFFDERGMAAKIFCNDILKECGVDFKMNDLFYSVSNKDVIRGMHFQIKPYEQEKIVSVIKGGIIDVVLDLRPDSKTFNKFEEFHIDGSVSIFIPRGCAHGFKSLEDNTVVMYAISGEYNREADTGIRWDSFGYDWKVENPILSSRDKKLIKINQYYKMES